MRDQKGHTDRIDEEGIVKIEEDLWERDECKARGQDGETILFVKRTGLQPQNVKGRRREKHCNIFNLKKLTTLYKNSVTKVKLRYLNNIWIYYV